MKSHSIPLKAHEVCAILDGSMTQTRRVAKLTDAAHIKEVGGHRRWHPADPDVVQASPYGQVGDQLWVRETWRILEPVQVMHPYEYVYRASGDGNLSGVNWEPSTSMPRAASRITLEITNVRVERLQDISEADATAEGTPHSLNHPAGRTAIENYEHLWECLNGDDSWELNPWVWVIEFKKVKP